MHSLGPYESSHFHPLCDSCPNSPFELHPNDCLPEPQGKPAPMEQSAHPLGIGDPIEHSGYRGVYQEDDCFEELMDFDHQLMASSANKKEPTERFFRERRKRESENCKNEKPYGLGFRV
ncbi:hypothetical protein R6Q59_004266 [Mikania micrantha]